ncbi:SOS response-associated peptidase [Pseudidiomarina insulisalsae]|uniref:Abasic site processing protein n=1 Tax=Pseudidiomarina insulisalsae TaxID=575789 RepID=A0A432YQC3_9GAMM|nr:SOS response-associated peptidase [Pseudidiomarina insulisalsae]RUO63548.1 DUF159 family protein [Pseudidiomarina insulisalsae]
MCGRMNVIAAPIAQYLREQLQLNFSTHDNTDLRPTQRVDTLMVSSSGWRQIPTHWGIQPQWAKRLIINAKVETAAEKKTFRQAFQQSRCLVPVSGWYEWRAEQHGKTKYYFSAADGQPLFMAGMVFRSDDGPRLVTSTTAPTVRCAQYHDRMPLLIEHDALDYWMHADIEQLPALFHAFPDTALRINASA